MRCTTSTMSLPPYSKPRPSQREAVAEGTLVPMETSRRGSCRPCAEVPSGMQHSAETSASPTVRPTAQTSVEQTSEANGLDPWCTFEDPKGGAKGVCGT